MQELLDHAASDRAEFIRATVLRVILAAIRQNGHESAAQAFAESLVGLLMAVVDVVLAYCRVAEDDEMSPEHLSNLVFSL